MLENISKKANSVCKEKNSKLERDWILFLNQEIDPLLKTDKQTAPNKQTPKCTSQPPKQTPCHKLLNSCKRNFWQNFGFLISAPSQPLWVYKTWHPNLFFSSLLLLLNSPSLCQVFFSFIWRIHPSTCQNLNA